MCAFSFFVKDDIAVISDLTDKLPYFRKLNNLISMSDGSNFFALDTGKLWLQSYVLCEKYFTDTAHVIHVKKS